MAATAAVEAAAALIDAELGVYGSLGRALADAAAAEAEAAAEAALDDAALAEEAAELAEAAEAVDDAAAAAALPPAPVAESRSATDRTVGLRSEVDDGDGKFGSLD